MTTHSQRIRLPRRRAFSRRRISSKTFYLLIAFHKLTRGALLLLVALLLLRWLRNPDLLTRAQALLAGSGIATSQNLVIGLVRTAFEMVSAHPRGAAVATLTYAIVELAEGVGLFRQQRWAEYLTVLVTASFVPFEAYDLIHDFQPTHALVLLLNVAAVVFLVRTRHLWPRGVPFSGHTSTAASVGSVGGSATRDHWDTPNERA